MQTEDTPRTGIRGAEEMTGKGVSPPIVPPAADTCALCPICRCHTWCTRAGHVCELLAARCTFIKYSRQLGQMWPCEATADNGYCTIHRWRHRRGGGRRG